MYEHNLLAYERDIRGCKFAPGCKFASGCKFDPGANCAHEHGFSLPTLPKYTVVSVPGQCLCVRVTFLCCKSPWLVMTRFISLFFFFFFAFYFKGLKSKSHIV